MPTFELEGRIPLTAIMPRGYGPSRSLEPPSGEPVPAVPFSPGADINSLPASSPPQEGVEKQTPDARAPGPTEGYPPIAPANLEAIAEAMTKQTVIWMDRALAMVEGEEFELLDEELGALGYTLMQAYERFLNDRTRGIKMRFGVQSVQGSAGRAAVPDVPTLSESAGSQAQTVDGGSPAEMPALRKPSKKRRQALRPVRGDSEGSPAATPDA